MSRSPTSSRAGRSRAWPRVATAAQGDYVRDLVRRDQEREEKLQRLRAAIDEGLASGDSDRDPFEYLEELRAGLRDRMKGDDAA